MSDMTSANNCNDVCASFIVGCSETTFVKEGYRNWKKATGKEGKFERHSHAVKNAQFKLRKGHIKKDTSAYQCSNFCCWS